MQLPERRLFRARASYVLDLLHLIDIILTTGSVGCHTGRAGWDPGWLTILTKQPADAIRQSIGWSLCRCPKEGKHTTLAGCSCHMPLRFSRACSPVHVTRQVLRTRSRGALPRIDSAERTSDFEEQSLALCFKQYALKVLCI